MKHYKVGFGIAAFLLATGTVSAQEKEITVTACPKNPSAVYVEISGTAAMELYSYASRSAGVPLAKLGGVIFNDMICHPIIKSKGEVKAVECSYLMMAGKNIPYPQLDPGFNGQEEILCD